MVHAAAIEEFEKKDTELTVPPGEPRPLLLVVMGPASCGKSTIGQQVADALHLPFVDGDSLHPLSNVEKMSNGIPLTDDDRLPWLALIRSTAERNCKEQWDEGKVVPKVQDGIGRPGIVIGCSALKKWYRDILRGHVEAIPPPTDDLPPNHDEAKPELKVDQPATSNLCTLFLYCHGTPELLAQRIAARKGHFMGARMLESQLATLQDPRGEVGVAWVDIDGTEEVVKERAVKNTQRLIVSELDQKHE